jgi:hypothetical protein
MDNSIESLRDDLERLGTTVGVMKPVVSFLMSSILPKADISRSRTITDDEAVAVEFFPLSKNALPLVFVFWRGNLARLEVFADNFVLIEIIIETHEDAIGIVDAIKVILSNPIGRVRIIRRNRVVKEIYTFSIRENGGIGNTTIKMRVGWAFSLSRPKRIEETFSAWIDAE